jgi:outer membrane protein, heavy metal efflux system
MYTFTRSDTARRYAAYTATALRSLAALPPLALALALFLGVPQAEAAPLELADFLTDVRETNLNIISMRHIAAAEERRAGPAGAWDDPLVSFGPDEIPIGEGMGMMRYMVSQGIPFPGKAALRRSATERRALAARAEVETLTRELMQLATATYLQALLLAHTIERNERIKPLLEQVADSERARYATGQFAHHGWLLAKLELDLLETEQLRLRRERDTVLATLNEMRGQPARTPLELPGAPPPVDGAIGAKTFQDAVAGQPEYEGARSRMAAAESDVALARRAYYPDFMVQGMFMQSLHPGEPHAWGAMVGLNVPLFWRAKQAEMLAEARLRHQALDADQRALEFRLAVAWDDAVRQWRSALDVYQQYEDVVIPRTRLAEESARSSYMAGVVTVREFLDIIRVRRVIENEHLAARLEVTLAETRLREFVAAPPMVRLAPMRPTLFGGDAMGMGAAPMDMPGRAAPPSPRMREMPAPTQPGSQMPGMGGM